MEKENDGKHADEHQHAPNKKSTGKSVKHVVLLSIGVLAVVVGRCFEMDDPSAYTIGGILGFFLSPAVFYLVILGIVALVVAALRGSIKKHWFSTLAWLFLIAGLFDIVVKGYNEFVLRPKLNQAVEDLARTGKIDLRDDLDPRQRLVGHWASEDDITHMYFASQRLTIVNFGQRKDVAYEILDFSVMEQWVKFKVSGADYEPHTRTIQIFGDGTALQIMEASFGKFKSGLKRVGPEQSP